MAVTMVLLAIAAIASAYCSGFVALFFAVSAILNRKPTAAVPSNPFNLLFDHTAFTETGLKHRRILRYALAAMLILPVGCMALLVVVSSLVR